MTLGIEIPDDLIHRIETEATRRNLSPQDVCREALESCFPPPDPAANPEFVEQIRLAREGMRRYRDTLRELAH